MFQLLVSQFAMKNNEMTNKPASNGMENKQLRRKNQLVETVSSFCTDFMKKSR
jgi:hypothetical protein